MARMDMSWATVFSMALACEASSCLGSALQMAWMIPNFWMSVVLGSSPFVCPALSTTMTLETMSSTDSDTEAPVRFVTSLIRKSFTTWSFMQTTLSFPSVM